MQTRLATDTDRSDIIALHVASWKSAYRGLLPDSFIDGAMADELAAYWQAPRPGSAFQILALDETGARLGFVAVTEEDGPYIEALHADPARRGKGIGRRLMQAAGAALAARGEEGVHLSVLVENTSALAFYRSLGGEVSAPYEDALFGVPLMSHKVRWTSLAPLLTAP